MCSALNFSSRLFLELTKKMSEKELTADEAYLQHIGVHQGYKRVNFAYHYGHKYDHDLVWPVPSTFKQKNIEVYAWQAFWDDGAMHYFDPPLHVISSTRTPHKLSVKDLVFTHSV
jgi:hypothetical protein